MSRDFSVLFLCTGNSCRSQMAEGFTRDFDGSIEVGSAGVTAAGVDPRAVRVMDELGIDISEQTSDRISALDTEREYDLVVTLCNPAKESCPVFPGQTEIVHRTFDDPPSLARRADSEEEALEMYRRVRDEIREFVTELIQERAG